MRTNTHLVFPLATVLLAAPAWADRGAARSDVGARPQSEGYRGDREGRDRHDPRELRDDRCDREHHDGCDRGDHRHGSPPVAGVVVLTNPNAEPVEVLLDGVPVGLVLPGDLAKLGPFAPGPHDLATRFVDPATGVALHFGGERIFVDPRHPVRRDLVPAREALVRFDNDWVEPMTAFVDGRPAGLAPARGSVGFTARQGSFVEVRGPGGELAMSYRVAGEALRREGFALRAPPVAPIRVRNETGAFVELTDRAGRSLGLLRPGEDDRFTIGSGSNGLIALVRGRPIDRIDLIASPFHPNVWCVQAPRAAFLDVRNEHPFALTVFVGERAVGVVAPYSRQRFEGVAVGTGPVRVVADRGAAWAETATWLTIDPFEGAVWTPSLTRDDGRRGHDHDGYGGHRVATRGDGGDARVWRRYGSR